MKRSQASSPLQGSSSHSHKKLKVSPPASQGVVQDNEDGEEWTKVENRKTKKVKKIESSLEKNPPRFMYVSGEIVKRKEAVRVEDIRDLVLHLIGDAPPIGWLKVENSRSIQKVVTLLIPGLTPSLLALPPLPTSATANPNVPLSIPLPDASSTDIPFIASTFSHACPTRAPGEPTRMHSVLSAFFHGPVSGEEKKKRIQQRLKSERALEKDPSRYMLSLEQMIENDYPIPSYMADLFQKPPGWVETPEAPQESLLSSPLKKKAKVYAIDCEMCLTEDGKELTRVCIIDYTSGIVIYDQLVKPSKPIIDYLTRWSGITEEALAPINTTLAEVQDRLLNLLSPPSAPTPILLGHSLESDLKALKLCHPFCIDTAIVYHHPRGRPLKPGLAWLTKKWCGREIQTRGEGGHDPEEDARACLDLLKKKIENGPGFGEFKIDYESIFERMSRAVGRGGPGSIRSAVVDHGNPAVMHGAKANTSVPCTNDAEVLEGLLQVIPAHEFSFGRFTALADAMGWLTPKATSDSTAAPSEPHPSASPTSLTSTISNLNTQLTELHRSLPYRTALIIFTGHSDPRRMTALNARKSAFEAALRSGKTAEDIDKDMWWTSSDARELEEVVEIAKRGLLFLGIK
ncbi:hypothetical protein PILCRDRAFT_823946 [Piloderma croceum F 1598]|uniref:Exonuclease domain-containing protein n=1 Tax=Piloderma croceum (strain F 1598) TaxID=765440 RepID=A0A0C3FG85_PILCF|nr:hypothetical protein PILCRDRAFT_823946 [Piloderma croceum F 1598]